ncbi:hypothetical protein BSLG_007697 [Batrachochytrium salamandrivorans]|nr:hypothetical protein BSLG_007697 [Batrachochytrium salamandrivorans]
MALSLPALILIYRGLFFSSTRLECTKRLLKRFVHQKQLMNAEHEFGICCVTDTSYWHLNLSSHQHSIMAAIDKMEFLNKAFPCCDLRDLFELLTPEMPLVDSGYSLRVILIYARSTQVPICPLVEDMAKLYEANPTFCVDTAYLHDPPLESNQVATIFQALGGLETSSSRHIELTRQHLRFLRGMTLLLANPMQRSNSVTFKWTI